MVVKDYFKDFTVRNNTSAYLSTWTLLKLFPIFFLHLHLC